MLVRPAFGGLGDDASSVQVDQLHFRGSLRTTHSDGYTVHEIESGNGIIVREYVSPSGKVFAVAWQGPWLPDMRQLLSTYFQQYQQAQQQQMNSHTGRKPLAIRQPGLVLQSGGHMRAFKGRAYIPDLLPAGVTPEEIQ